MARHLPTDFWDRWQQDLSGFLRLDLPKIFTVIVEALVLIFILRWITGRLAAWLDVFGAVLLLIFFAKLAFAFPMTR